MLIDSNQRLISTGTATSSGLVFNIPGQYKVDDCAAVVDTKRKLATDRPYVYLSLRSEYQKLLEQRRAAAALEADSRNQAGYLRGDAQATAARLSSNRAYSNQACALLPPGPLPPPPALKCENRDQCVEEGKAVCYAGLAVAKACGKMIGAAGVSGAITGPACGKAVAELQGLGQQYGLREAVIDSLVGAMDDNASELLKSDSTGDNILGGLVKLAIAAKDLSDTQSCIEDFAKVQFDEPQEKWQAETDRIRAEPVELQNSCLTDAQHLAALGPRIDDAEATTANQQARIQTMDSDMRHLTSLQVPIEWCVARQ